MDGNVLPAVEAFDRNAVDYLVKPVGDERLSRAIARLKAKIGARETPPGLGEVLARILQSEGRGLTMVFCRTKRMKARTP